MKLIFGNRRNSSSSFSRTYRMVLPTQGPWRCREGLLRGPTGGHARAQQATALAQQMRAPLGKRGVVALSKAASIPFPVLLGVALRIDSNRFILGRIDSNRNDSDSISGRIANRIGMNQNATSSVEHPPMTNVQTHTDFVARPCSSVGTSVA